MRRFLMLTAALALSATPAFAAVNEVPCDPTAYASTALWLDAADTAQVTQSGGTVSSWGDKSGNGNAVANPTTADQPGVSTLNGRQILTFNGTVQNLTKSSNTALPSGTSPFTVYIIGAIANTNTGTNEYTLSYGNGSARNGFYYASNSGWGYDIGGGYFSYATGPTPTTTPHLATSVYTGGNFGSGYQQYQDGALQPKTTPFDNAPSSPAGAAVFVGSNESSQDYYGGTIGEVLVHIGADSTMVQQETEGCLAWKWGLQANLPTSHPFAAAPPWRNIGNGQNPQGAVGTGHSVGNAGGN